MCVVKYNPEDFKYDPETLLVSLPKEAGDMDEKQRVQFLFDLFLCLLAVVATFFLNFLLHPSFKAAGYALLWTCIGIKTFHTRYVNQKRFNQLNFLQDHYISKLLLDDAYRASESEKAKAAAVDAAVKSGAAAAVRHGPNRERNAKAKLMYESQTWPTKVEAARTLAAKFHVAETTADRWITEWGRL